MNPSSNHSPDSGPLTRRGFLSRSGMGFAMLGLGGILADEERLRATASSGASGAFGVTAGPLAPKAPHFAPKAKRIIHIFLNGGVSHVDTFDPKPLLQKYDGKELPTPNLVTERETGAAFGSPFKFQRYGDGGLEIS